MTTELTKAAQQALEQLEFLNACYPHKTAADAIASLQSALTQRPVAQTEREAFEAWYAALPNNGRKAGLTLLDAWQARASLPAPQQATPDQFADASKMVPPVALRSVRLTRDTAGMCVVRINGRVAIRDNGDIIDHTATLEWFADTQQATPEPVGEVVAWQRRDRNIVTGEWSEWHEDDDIEEVLDPEWAERRPLFTRPAPGVPEGFALVPVEPTLEIIQAICHAKNQTRRGISAVMTDSELSSIYHAMLAAAQAKGEQE